MGHQTKQFYQDQEEAVAQIDHQLQLTDDVQEEGGSSTHEQPVRQRVYVPLPRPQFSKSILPSLIPFSWLLGSLFCLGSKN